MDYLYLALSFLAGIGLGVMYFGGLWYTLRKLPTLSSPALVLFVSFWVRLGLLLLGVYLVSRGHWQQIAVCLLGIVVARFIMVRWLLPRPAKNG